MIAVVASDSMKAVLAATPYRRRGLAVMTQFSGNRKRQLRRAFESCDNVIDMDRPETKPGRAFDAAFPPTE